MGGPGGYSPPTSEHATRFMQSGKVKGSALFNSVRECQEKSGKLAMVRAK